MPYDRVSETKYYKWLVQNGKMVSVHGPLLEKYVTILLVGYIASGSCQIISKVCG